MTKKKVTDSNEQINHIDSVYRSFLTKLDIAPEDLTALQNRGFSEKQIKLGEYKSMPKMRLPVAKALAKEFELKGVPGFYKDDADNWTFAGINGLLIPIRNTNDKITGMKIRARDNDGFQKYTVMSSDPSKKTDQKKKKYKLGTKCPTAVHFPAGKRTKKIRITEGELKADFASYNSTTYTISLPGVSQWRWGLDAIRAMKTKPEQIILSFDSDKDNVLASYEDPDGKPHQVGKTLSKLFLALNQEGFNVTIEHWPEDHGKGIDDVLINHDEDSLQLWSEEECQEWCENQLREDETFDWFLISNEKKFYKRKTNGELMGLDMSGFNLAFAHFYQKGTASDNCTADPAFPKFHSFVYEPKKRRVIKEEGFSFYNTYEQPQVEPCEGDASVFTNHLEYILPDESERNILTDFIAWNVRRPGQKIKWALLMQGIQGTGKSYFGRVIELILGKSNISRPSNEALSEKSTKWQENCCFILIEELRTADDRVRIMNKLKPMITENTANVRKLYHDEYEINNYYNVMMLTNEDGSILIDDHDRRYSILRSPAVIDEQHDFKYFKTLFDWTEANPGVILNYLKSRDLTWVEQANRAPITKARGELVIESQSNLEAWINDGIKSNTWPFNHDILTLDGLMPCIPKYLISSRATPRKIAKILDGVEGVQRYHQQMRLGDGSKPIAYLLRNAALLQQLSASELGARFEADPLDVEPGGNPLMKTRPF